MDPTSLPIPANMTESQNRQLLALREAVLAISSDLSLSETLKRIVAAAAQLVNARYAALGVPDESGETLIEFITTGFTAEQEARISHRPRGHGILGLILREGKSLRLKHLSEHPQAVGFPAHHPPMASFLGVPIVQKGQQVGDLYLTDKIGAEEFTEEDQAIIELLASHASIALRNARLYQATVERSQELQERNRELAAVNAVAEAISAHLDLERVMTEALDQVLAVTEAEVGNIFLVDESTDDLVLALHRGPFPELFQSIRQFKRGQGFPGQVAELGRPLLSTDIAHDARYLRREVIEAGFKSYVSIPLFAKGKVVCTLDLAARKVEAFDEAGLPLLSGIGHQIGIAVENARLHQQVAKLAVLEERQRIGMDLHDGVIQSIYAVGLTLEYVDAQLIDGDTGGASDRLKQAVDALNATIH
ncbi:MAG TPA: GAF domain-containing protein, partial [Anaerolineales bacterium]|nr:GAF domain-containing protein [Anaerolineales bacterium]